MTEIVVHESVLYRAERYGESCHFGTSGGAKAWAGTSGTVTPIKLRRAALRQIETDADKDASFTNVARNPDAYAIRNDQGFWVGIWADKETAELVLGKGQKSHNEVIISLYAATGENHDHRQ